MTSWVLILSALVIGMTVLMASFLMRSEPKRNIRAIFIESMAWAGIFFLVFSTEIMAFATP